MDEMLEPEDIAGAKIDLESIRQGAGEDMIVTPRSGLPYKSLPMVSREAENRGGYIGAPTLTALQAIMPSYNWQLARDDSTGNEYRWNPAASPTPKWEPTGRRYVDDAVTISNAYTNTRVGEFINSPPLDIFTITNKITGSYVGKTGVQNASASWSCSGFLKVNVRDVLIFNASATNAVAFIAAYDANKVFLRELVAASGSSVSVLNGQKEIDADVKFIRVSFYTANSTAYSFQIKPFQFETDMLNKRETSDMVMDELTAKPNLFDVTKARNGYSLVNNVETGNTNWVYSDYIPVIPSEAYTSNKSGFKSGPDQTGIHYYDANKVFLTYADPQLAGIPFTVPLNASYMRLNFVKTINPEIGVDDIVVNHGLTAKKNGRFEEKVQEILQNSSNVLHRYNGLVYIPIGDSITDSTTTPTTYPPIVAKHFGMTLIDFAISGSRIRSSFVKASATNANILAGNIFTIAHGTNDFKIETPIGSITDTPTTRTLLGDSTYTTVPSNQENHLFNPSTAIDGSYLLNNVLTTDAAWFVSDYIAVRGQIKYTSNGSSVGDAATGVHFYDASKNFISYGPLNTTGVPFSIPNGVSFIRVNFKKSNSKAMNKTSVAQGTFYADYRGVIESILAININARIMLITPIRRTQAAWTGTDTNSFGHKLVDYTDAIIEIGKYYSLPVLDNYRTSGFNHLNIVALSKDGDGLHPNTWAQANIMAPKVIGFIESN